MNKKEKAERRVKESRKMSEKVSCLTKPKITQLRVTPAASKTPLSRFDANKHRQRITITARSRRASGGIKQGDQFDQNYAIVSKYLKWVENQGHKLPESVRQRGKVFYAQLAVEAGVSVDAFTLSGRESENSYNLRLRRLVEAAAVRIGTEVRILPHSPGRMPTQLTYEILLSRGTLERKRQLDGRRGAYQQLYNTRTALNRLRKFHGFTLSSPVSAELTTGFKKSLRNILEGITNENSRKKFQAEIVWWHNFYRRLIKEQALPEDFHEALAYLVDQAGLSIYALARLIDMSGHTLSTWYHGKKMPSGRSLQDISNIESLFRLPVGTLTNKVIRWRVFNNIPRSQTPFLLQQDTSLARRIRRHLPHDFLDRSEVEQEEIVKYIREEVVKFDDPYMRRLTELQPLEYSLKEWPVRLQREYDDLALFKTAERPPLGMKRNERWRPTTEKFVRGLFARFHGAARLPNDAEEIRLRGLGIPEDELTMALLACPLVVDWYVRYQCEVRNSYTEFALRFIQLIMSLVRSGTGWLRQNPGLASRLRPLSYGRTELISTELIKKAQTDWEGVCDDAVKHYKHLVKEIKPLIKVARDPFSRIEGILDMDDPIKSFGILAEKMRGDLPNPRMCPTQYHGAIRDFVMILLIQTTSLRRNTVAQLDYTGDSEGHLKLKGGRYVLDIPRQLFKAEDSSFFGPKGAQMGFHMELPNVYGFYELISEYLKTSRPFLLQRYHQESSESPLFVSTKQAKSVRITPRQVSAVYSQATEKYLVVNKYIGIGIDGVKKHGPHSARHVRATTILKKGGSFQDAADANHTSEPTARKSYARWSTGDRSSRVNKMLFDL